MEYQLFAQLIELGFTRQLYNSIVRAAVESGKIITASERMQYRSKDMKFLAYLKYEKATDSLSILGYDAVHLGSRKTLYSPKAEGMNLGILENSMSEVNWNARDFDKEYVRKIGMHRDLEAQVKEIEKMLQGLQQSSKLGEVEADILRLKYMADTIYGYQNNITSHYGSMYDSYFDTLSILPNPSYGLLPVKHASNLLLEGVSNRLGTEYVQKLVSQYHERIGKPQRLSRGRNISGDGENKISKGI